MTIIKRLLEPVLEGGVQSTHYFNGRVLTAEDLQADQAANRFRRQLLAQTVGEGVLTGLEVCQVEGNANAVRVTPGQAIARDGQLYRLAVEDLRIEIVPEEQETAVRKGGFADCRHQIVGKVATGSGLYVLLAGPASGFAGTAPLSGVSGDGKITGCGSRYSVEGVQFRLALYRTASALVEYEPLRNRVAHDLLGTTDQTIMDLFASRKTYGGLDQMRADKVIGADEVPLALLYWDQDGIRWLDMWAVRRRVAPALSGTPWDALVGPRRQAEAEAMLMQFQDDLAAYRTEAGVPAPVLRNRFRFLPPFGYLPLDLDNARGSDDEELWELLVLEHLEGYLEGIPYRRVYPDEAFLRSMLLKAALVDPIDLWELDESPILGVFWREGMECAIFFRKGRGTRPTARV